MDTHYLKNALAQLGPPPDNPRTPTLKGDTMKHLLLALLIAPALSLASGKIQVKPGYYIKAEKFGGQVGLSIYEPVFGGVAINQWIGVGTTPRPYDDSVFYAVSETSFEKWFGKVGAGVGYKFSHSSKSLDPGVLSEHCAFIRASYQLW